MTSPDTVGPGARPLVIVTEPIEPEASAWLGEWCELAELRPGAGAIPDDLAARALGLVVRTYTRVDAALLARMPALRVVGRAGVGLDHIDLGACRASGVKVVHTPEANSDAVAEFVFALLLRAVRPLARVDAPLPAEGWEDLRRGLTARRELGEMTLGILGLGRIGSRVARIARGFGMRVLYHDLVEIPAPRRHGAEAAARDALLAGSDVLTIHVDARAGNRGLVNGALLARLRADVILLNTSRGMVMDTAALAAFLREHPRALAMLDVHEPEPLDAAYPLLGLPNAFLTPHAAAATRRAHRAMSWVVRDVWAVLSGGAPRHPAA